MSSRFLKNFCVASLSVAVIAMTWQSEASAQGRKLEKRDGQPVQGRPDRRSLNLVPVNILPKFRELRTFSQDPANVGEEFRTQNGVFNNLTDARLGSIFVNLLRTAPEAYGPNNGLARQDQPSVRVISNAICAQNSAVLNDRNLTDFAWQWGQFMDHDLDLTEFQKPEEPAPIPVALGDPIFDPSNLGGRTMSFNRSLHRPRSILLLRRVRQQVNEITAWIDASNVYGSDLERAHSLRSFENGRLLTSDDAGLFLPTEVAANGNLVFLAGDIRSTEQVGLSTVHTLFMREHNRLAAEIQAANPGFDDEEIYQRARKEVYAILESITYNEWLPALMGPDALSAYEGYDSTVNPNIANEFSGCAFRFGHTMLNNQLQRLNDDGTSIDEGAILLRDSFFDATRLLDFGVEPYLKGLMTQKAQEIDTQFINAVRNFLFANQPDANQGPAGPIGFDLASLNFQRGRDHGIAGINGIRIAYGLTPYASFEDLTDNPLLRAQLQSMYDDVDNIDPLIAMLAEEHVSGSSLGSTITAILKDQFERVRDGDRFWYENVFSPEDVERISNTTLADVIRRNTTLTNVQDNVFFTE